MNELIQPNIAGPCQHRPIQQRCAECILDASDYFSGLSIGAKRDLQPALHYKQYDRRTALYRAGEPGEQLFVLISGEIKLYKSLPNGRHQIHKLAQIPGDLIACEDLYRDDYTSTAESITPLELCVLNRKDLFSLMERHGEISDTLMHSMARNLNAYINHIASLGQKSALERVASYIVFLHATHRERDLRGEVLVESLTRSELADMIGVTQRTLIRSLKELETRNIISLDKVGFTILDFSTLRHLSAGR
ncbi:Crp/Fnr family transcriptional regulator [Thiohalomonas denitrificans]|uniref:Crp-like helix-turn-helix domain-containing protein n=1 Tax=Thiohalomonas denitrificans TaxID=415747 RepID=A0A1G5Q7U4_9GAMM|nr:Crp/Fnr family transcriptional regulator [Thiohalomonas denitrificans]SCZ57955.1 Crp-like helix-turn-helix domain-containing protein [Thiohalomonas denitrificans]